MSASRSPWPRLPGPPSAHHARPRRALRRGAGPLAAVLAALLALLAPAGAGAQNLPEVKILRGSNPTSVTEGQDVTFALTRPPPSSENFLGGGSAESLDLTVLVSCIRN